MLYLIDNGHGVETPGKRSPDGRFREYAWTREIARRVVLGLSSELIPSVLLVPEENDIPLQERVCRVKKYCGRFGKDNVALVSIHCNAAGKGDCWHNASGWSAYTSRGRTKSDIMASEFYTQAKFYLPGHKIRTDYTDGDEDFESNFYLLQHTPCAAVLTENGFMDSKESLEFLESEEGRMAIVNLHVDAISSFDFPF